MINPILPNVPFWHQKTFGFQGDQKGPLGRKGLRNENEKIKVEFEF